MLKSNITWNKVFLWCNKLANENVNSPYAWWHQMSKFHHEALFWKCKLQIFSLTNSQHSKEKKKPYEDNTKVAEVWEKFVRVSLGGKFYAFDTIMDKSYWEQWWCLFSEMDEQRSPTQILLFHNIILHNVKTSKNLFYSNMYTIFSSILYPLYTSHPDSL